ncbi:MGMT family protein [Moritella sp. F3]|uniref:MGMT family protein n=1 Tax=Moritella sp. F3 TaxID=2718882 RepID=UPI0018E178F2|nr:MGMT family protein [Moritella sp. F3]GIC78212.1 mgmt family protein [Moritella sp. F1]GIC81144.1 mgmt family protein [Moritella sp. F3]
MNDFTQQVFAFVYQVPVGKVATYGDIAKLAGMPSHARQVGKILSNLPADTKLPWYRIVNSQGKISLQGERGDYQRQQLAAEGILLSAHGSISLRTYRIVTS